MTSRSHPTFTNFLRAPYPSSKLTLLCGVFRPGNDNGKKDLVDSKTPELLYRTDFFGGLGWMMTKELWINEIGPKWPKSVNLLLHSYTISIYDFL